MQSQNIWKREEALCFAKILLAAEGRKQNLGLPGRSPGTLQNAIFWSSLVCYLFSIQFLYKSPLGIQKDLYLDVQGRDPEKIKYQR
jgi:hypothetical protein